MPMILPPGIKGLAPLADDAVLAARNSFSTARDVARGRVGTTATNADDAPGIIGTAGRLIDGTVHTAESVNEKVMGGIMLPQFAMGAGFLAAGAGGKLSGMGTWLLPKAERIPAKLAVRNYNKAWEGIHKLADQLVAEGAPNEALKHVRDMRYALGGGVGNMNPEKFKAARDAFEASMSSMPKPMQNMLNHISSSAEWTAKCRIEAQANATGLSKALRWTGNKIEGAASWVRIPEYALSQTTLGGAAETISNTTGLTTPGFIKSIGRGIADATHWTAGRIGLSGWRHAAHANKMATHVGNASTALSELGLLTSGLSSEAAGHLSDLQKAATAVDMTAYSKAQGALGAIIKKEITDSTMLGAIGGHLGTAENALKEAAYHQATAASWGNVRQSTMNVTSRIAKSSVGHGVLNASFLMAPALGTYSVARSAVEKTDSLRHMLADLTGKNVKDISTFQVMTGNVPPIVAEARSHIIKEHGLRGMIQAGGFLMAAYSMMKRGNVSFKAFLLPQLAGYGADLVMGESVLAVYAPISKAYNDGAKLAPQDYAAFVAAASKELANHRSAQAFANAVGEQYAAMQPPPSPAQILKEMESGQFKTRLHDIAAKADAARHQPHAPAVIPQLQGQQEQRPTLGHHTAQVKAQEARAQQPGVSPTLAS